MTNSRAKGKAGELEFARLCRSRGYEVRRTAQYCGKTGDAADCVGLPGIHIEVKRVEHLNIDDALDQARRDAEAKQPAHRGPSAQPHALEDHDGCSRLV